MTTDPAPQYRAVFDADVAFPNGGSLAVREFRLDIDSATPSVPDIGLALVRHLGLLMVGSVEVSDLRVVAEAHRGGRGSPVVPAVARIVDLSHPVEHEMPTYPGLPGPQISAHVSREKSAASLAPGTSFEIGRIDMVGNTGTYLDAPWHRFAGGTDLADLPLGATADLRAVVVDVRGSTERGIGAEALAAADVDGAAVLVLTGWDRHWRTPEYGSPAPYVTRDAATWLVANGARLVGIDSVNIDDMADLTRPAHTILLDAGIPIVEHLSDLAAVVGAAGVRFHAAPMPIRHFGTVGVRAYAVVNGA